MKLSNNISLDWLSFTLAYSDESMAHARSLGDGYEFTEQQFGRFKYNASTRMLDGAHIYYNLQRKDMGIHVVINAASLALLEYRPLQLINMVFDWGGKIKRLDLAFDEYEGLLDMDEMYRKIEAGEVSTRFRKMSRILGGEVGSGEKSGDTINMGRRSSGSYVRIYDKAAEQIAKEATLPEGVTHWVRVELEMKGDKAQAVAELLGGTALSSDVCPAQEAANLLYGLLDFKQIGVTDSNKHRWETADWWAEFIQATSKLTLSLPKKEKSIDRSKAWFKNQVSATIAMILLSEPDDNGISGWDFIVACMVEGEEKMKAEKKKMLNEYNRQQRDKAKEEYDALWMED